MRRDVRRRLEQYAANPRCTANALSAVHDVDMETVARSAGLDPAVGQSPFALYRGQQFERGLFDEEAQRLRRALIERKVLPANATGFVDLRLTRSDGPTPSLDVAYLRFQRFLRDAAKATGEARMLLPTIVAGATLRVPGGAVVGDGLFALDVLTVHPQPRPAPITLRVGEVKVYPDRGGFTDPLELASARAQAGLYVHVLDREVQALGLDRELLVADDGFLVLTRPGSNQPSVRAGEDLRHQAERASAMFSQVQRLAEQPSTAEGSAASQLTVVLGAPKRYGDACLSFCALADHCQVEALALGIPAALGEDLGRFLGSLSLHRGIALLHGEQAVTDAEKDFVRRVR